jgi:hypothetical protein
MRQALWFMLAMALSLSVAAADRTAPDSSRAARDEMLETYRRYTQATLQRDIVRQLLAALPRDERRALESARFIAVFDRNPYRVGLLRGVRGHPVIEVGAAFVATMDVGSDATAVAARTQRSRDLIGFANRNIAALQRIYAHASESSRPLQTAPGRFADYIEWPEEQYDAFQKSDTYRSLRLAQTFQTLVWVSAHYIEHWRLERERAGSAVVEPSAREREIDARTVRLSYAAGFSPTPPLINAMQFAALEYSGKPPGASTPLCRALRIMAAGLAISEGDPDAVARFGAGQRSPRTFADERQELERMRAATQCADPD